MAFNQPLLSDSDVGDELLSWQLFFFDNLRILFYLPWQQLLSTSQIISGHIQELKWKRVKKLEKFPVTHLFNKMCNVTSQLMFKNACEAFRQKLTNIQNRVSLYIVITNF